MKKIIFISITICLTNILFSQTENYTNAMANFEENYNAKKYDEVFNEFSPQMQRTLPLENTQKFLTRLKVQFGDIIKNEFVNDENGTGAIYKTQFERATLAIYISLDNKNKIDIFLIK